ncbi:MAG: hypothetical protein ACYTGN_18985 [Planctomycetota bacterium]|jgi:phospholipase/lecithinase/hemolysin
MKRLFFVLSLFAVAFMPAAGADEPAHPYDELIVFGASMSDTGNAQFLTGGDFPPADYFGGRVSNGPVWVERLAERLGFGTPTEQNPVPAPSFLGGTNFAVGGANPGDGFSRLGAPNFDTQIDFFFASGRTLDGDELIVIQGMGGVASGVDAAFKIAEHIERLAEAGGQYFLINNHFRSSQAPGVFADGGADARVAQYDITLGILLDALADEYGITIHYFDLLALTDDMIANPGDYGFTNVTDRARLAVGEDADEYMWWDNIHFTGAAHGFIGDAAADLALE